ncbi:MAG: NUDIX hydrolase [Clostridia bacterium]|nr:NUDIX hydrolase [Clostridia bacterium]
MKIKKIEKLTKEKHLNYYKIHYVINGKENVWTLASRRSEEELECAVRTGKVDTISIIPQFTKDDENYVLMQFDSRPAVGQTCLSFCAGTVEHNEVAVVSAKREMLEELGIPDKSIISYSQLNTLPAFKSAGMTDESCIFFTFEFDYEKIERQHLEETEGIKRVPVKIKDLPKLITKQVMELPALLAARDVYHTWESNTQRKLTEALLDETLTEKQHANAVKNLHVFHKLMDKNAKLLNNKQTLI